MRINIIIFSIIIVLLMSTIFMFGRISSREQIYYSCLYNESKSSGICESNNQKFLRLWEGIECVNQTKRYNYNFTSEILDKCEEYK